MLGNGKMTERRKRRGGWISGRAAAALLALLCLFCLTPSARAATYEEALALYRSEQYVTPDAEQNRLLEAADERYRPALYAAVTGSGGISWFRVHSGTAPETVARYWTMDPSALASAVLDMAKNGRTDSPEFLLAEQLFFLREKAVGTLYLSTRGSGVFYLRDCVRLSLPRGDAELAAEGIVTAGARLTALSEDLEQFRRSTDSLRFWAERMRYEERARAAVNAWAAYCGVIAGRQESAVKRCQDEVNAAREAADAEKAAAREREEAALAAAEAAQEIADERTYTPTAIPTDRGYTPEQQRLLSAVPRRYMPAVCFFFDDGSLTPDRFFESCTAEAYRADAARLLKLSQTELEAEYIRLVELKNAGKAAERDANLLELTTELLNVRYFRRGDGFLPVYITLSQDGAKGIGYDVDLSKFSYADFTLDAKAVQSAEERVRQAAKYPDSAFYRDFFALCRAFVSYKGYAAAAAQAVAVDGDSHYYILETCTGQGNGKGVRFFRIVYESGAGNDRTESTQYVFPTENSLAEGYRRAQELGTEKERLDFLASLGYAPGALTELTALGSFQTDQFLFAADRRIESVKEIQAYMSDGGSASWTCYALRLYEVDAIAGLKHYGYYSSDPYIDFSGSLIARVLFGDEEETGMMTGANHELTPDSSDVLFRFGEGGRSGYRLAAYAPGEVPHYLEDGADNVIFRVDFADQFGAGLECLATAWDGDKTLSGGGLCEALTLRVRYRDAFGAVRQTHLPMITSAAG